MEPYIDYLARQAQQAHIVVTADLDDALRALDNALEQLAAQLQVEYVGPGVGVEGAADVYKLVVRAHEWVIHQRTWSLKICDALPNAQWRAAWPVHGASRARKIATVRALPKFMQGFAAAIAEAGKSDTPAGQRIAAMARAFQ